MASCPPLTETFAQMLRQQTPNFLRLYLNPYVAQACYCLTESVRYTFSTTGEYQTFLANCFDEALSGAIKLARYAASVAGRPTAGLILDPHDCLGPYASARAGNGRVEFLPGLTVIGKGAAPETALASRGPFGLVVLVASGGPVSVAPLETLRELVRRDAPLLITCLDRFNLTVLRATVGMMRGLTPDITIFDESFTDHAVPFAAFTARKELYDHWNRPGKTTFHSTTFQPNTIASLHFLRCLAESDAEFYAQWRPELEKMQSDLRVCGDYFRRLYSPSLYRLIRATGFATDDIRAAGDFVHVNGQPILDTVSGVACSVRGHNPPGYAAEVEALAGVDCEAEVTARLQALTGLDCVLPAVSGATAVENALKLALVAQYPRRHVLALQSGFGGKTLLALTGTANPSYKERIEPLYADVHYVDPFAADAESQIDAVLNQHAVAVVQLELIQAVGGVRRVPERVVRHLEARRRQAGYLLLVDEVQTGMYRTGPFTLSGALGLAPDLLLLGKGTSDMMFPFALLQYSAAVRERLERAGSDLAAVLRQRYGYEYGYRTVLNVLRFAEACSLAARVTASGELFARLLSEQLAGCPAVREVRAFGLLIGIELDDARWPRRWFRKRLATLYLFSMLRHHHYPVLAGFCQYEPNVLKITPALTVAEGELRALCATLAEVLKSPFTRVLTAALGGLLWPSGVRRPKHEHANDRADDAVAR